MEGAMCSLRGIIIDVLICIKVYNHIVYTLTYNPDLIITSFHKNYAKFFFDEHYVNSLTSNIEFL